MVVSFGLSGNILAALGLGPSTDSRTILIVLVCAPTPLFLTIDRRKHENRSGCNECAWTMGKFPCNPKLDWGINPLTLFILKVNLDPTWPPSLLYAGLFSSVQKLPYLHRFTPCGSSGSFLKLEGVVTLGGVMYSPQQSYNGWGPKGRPAQQNEWLTEKLMWCMVPKMNEAL